ncbi:hypothetical protein [Asaia sp. As-1742]|uniref:hypothetical protein n=1 Tax=Asaia sp. As-1742 TaxID=2608325 RepID=UPI001420C51D|nr:hypothetical protein [Asaia sp. As-1742]NIE79522.1 hypothetical protein [Asaia sp. As-1742]
MADGNAMMISLLALIGGWALCLALIALVAPRVAHLRRQPAQETYYTHAAWASLIGAFWLSSAPPPWPFHSAMLMSGALSAPFCTLPIYRRLVGRVEALSRAASGLGAGSRARIRLLWFPLLRGPILLSCLISLVALTFCFMLAKPVHV